MSELNELNPTDELNPTAVFAIPTTTTLSPTVPSIQILPGLQATLTIRLSADLVLPLEDLAQCHGKPLAELAEELINEQLKLYMGC